MTHRSTLVTAIALVAQLGLAAGTGATADAALLGNTMKIVSSTPSIVTGDTWTVTAEVDDLLGNPVAGATVWTGSKEPSLGCGSDLSAAACTALATVKKTADSAGRVTLARPATLDTFVVLYLADSQGAIDPTTGQSVSVRTHNNYAWSGSTSTALQQFVVGATPYMRATGSAVRIASGSGTATPRTEVSTDGGTQWTTIARGTKSGAFAFATAPGSTSGRNVFASRPGTYSLRVTDSGGAFEDAGASPVVTVTVTAHSPEWLARTNAYRSSLGLAPIADYDKYDAAIAQHVHWMRIHQQLSHSEASGSAGYSAAGNEAAGASVLAYGHPTATSSVDGWIGAPFHATCLLNADWAVGGFATSGGWAGEWCHSALRTIDIATGALGPVPATLRQNFTYPSAAMKVPVTTLLNGNEAPDPVTGCAAKGLGRYWSVPIIFRVARPPASDPGLARASASVATKAGRTLPHSCLLTGTTYRGPDAGSTQIGRLILGDRVSGRWAVLLVKAGSLRPGSTYSARLRDGTFLQRTTFTIAHRS